MATCGRCGQPGHTYRTCAMNPLVTVRIEVLATGAETLWIERLNGIWLAAAHDSNPLRAAMVSAYLQGALDGRRAETSEALAALMSHDAPAVEWDRDEIALAMAEQWARPAEEKECG